ncbi:hypothetical protein BZA05DRAFT_334278, partial [Tricharina praecox]|uniref:uncharacterized protein n=1 Tax=Tricharina praecox TaxID=43433 RepID=UPI00221E8485
AAPLWDQVEYKNLRFSSGPWVKTPYKGAPTPAIDEAWNAIVPLYLIRIPAAAIPHLNKSATAATFPGSSDYLGTVDAFHQLHCVNLVRKYTYADYYKDIDIAWRDPPDMLRTHVDHCIDVLRQKIMCDADVSVITYSWVEGREHVLPDFSNTHRCRNFDKVRDWVLENKMDMGSREITKSKEAVSVPTEAL